MTARVLLCAFKPTKMSGLELHEVTLICYLSNVHMLDDLYCLFDHRLSGLAQLVK